MVGWLRGQGTQATADTQFMSAGLRAQDGHSRVRLGIDIEPTAGVKGRPFFGAGKMEKPVRLPKLQGASKREIAIRLSGVTVIFLIDDSGSMYGSGGDP